MVVQVGLQAYLMWEQAGKPDGANFSDDARRQLEQQLQSGKSVQDLERALKGPFHQPQEQQPAQVTAQSICPLLLCVTMLFRLTTQPKRSISSLSQVLGLTAAVSCTDYKFT